MGGNKTMKESIKEITDMFCIKSEVDEQSASYFAWVIGGGLNLRNNAGLSVNNPSLLTHENIN